MTTTFDPVTNTITFHQSYMRRVVLLVFLMIATAMVVFLAWQVAEMRSAIIFSALVLGCCTFLYGWQCANDPIVLKHNILTVRDGILPCCKQNIELYHLCIDPYQASGKFLVEIRSSWVSRIFDSGSVIFYLGNKRVILRNITPISFLRYVLYTRCYRML